MGKVNVPVLSLPRGLRGLWVASVLGLGGLMVSSEQPWLVFLSGVVGCIGGAAGMLIEISRNG